MARTVRSRVQIFRTAVRHLEQAQIAALDKTAQFLQDEIRDAQVIPRDTGALQGEKFFIDRTRADKGKVSLMFEGPYARRLYYHPEYHFNQYGWDEKVYGKRGRFAKNGKEYKGKTVHHEGNSHAKGKWLEDWSEGGRHARKAKEKYALFLKREMRHG